MPPPLLWADPNDDGTMPPAPVMSAASPFVSPAADGMAPLAKVAMGGGTPPVFDPGSAPAVSRIPTPIEGQIGETDQRLRKLQQMDANPYGSPNNHPGVGGKILHALSVAGNIAGDIFAPATMELIPGTQLNRRVQEGNLSSRLQDLTRQQAEDEASGASTAKTKLETQELPQAAADRHDLAQAQEGNLESETEERLHPHPQFEVHDTAEGPMFVNKQNGQAQRLSVDGLPVGPKIQTDKVQLQIGGKPHQVLVNKDTGEPIKDLGESGEKPPSVNVNAGISALDRESKQFGTTHQKSLDASNAQLEKIADARAMINGNAESQGLGIPKVLTALVGGQGTGVRITQAELQSIAHARGVSGDIEGTLNKWAGKGALSKDQQKQLTQIMDDVKSRIVEKQNIAQTALDSINGASTREQIIEADKTARKNLADFERYGIYSGKQVKLKNGQTVTVNHVHADGSFD
jgi:hypothetical protein